jgi:hypothetical protein
MDNLNCDVKEKVGPLIDSCKEYSLGISLPRKKLFIYLIPSILLSMDRFSQS